MNSLYRNLGIATLVGATLGIAATIGTNLLINRDQERTSLLSLDRRIGAFVDGFGSTYAAMSAQQQELFRPAFRMAYDTCINGALPELNQIEINTPEGKRVLIVVLTEDLYKTCGWADRLPSESPRG